VWLERYGLWASARHAEVQAALSDWQTFSSAAGVGIDDFRRTKPWRPPSLILEADPPLHTRSRTVMKRALSAKPMAGLRVGFKEAAENSRTNSSLDAGLRAGEIGVCDAGVPLPRQAASGTTRTRRSRGSKLDARLGLQDRIGYPTPRNQ